MGCCASVPESNNSTNSRNIVRAPSQAQVRHNNSSHHSNRQQNQTNRTSVHSNNTAAPPIEQIIQGQFIGEGVKKTFAYETTLTKTEFLKWREEFWNTRVEGASHIWTLLRRACEEDHQTASVLLEAAEVTTEKGSLTHCYDVNGRSYKVPISCINEPMNFRPDYEPNSIKQKEVPAHASLVTINIRNTLVAGDKSVEIMNDSKIIDLKKVFLESIEKSDLGVDHVRLFYMGRELKDETGIFAYEMSKDVIVQAMIRN